MIVFGILMGLGGTCLGVVFGFAPESQIEQIIRQPGMPPEMTVEIARMGYTIIGALIAVVAIVFIVLAVFVRRGARGAIVTSIVLTILGVLFTGCNVAVGLSQGGPAALIGLVPVLLTVWLLVWLFNANTAAGQWQQWQMQYAAQYYQYQQGQQAYPSQQPQTWQQPGQPQQWPSHWQQPPSQQQQWPPPPSTPT
jgi:hypothetical protein